MLVHCPLTNVNNTTCDFNNALVTVEINIKVPLIWVIKGSYFGFGSPNNRLKCMQGQKNTFIFLIICIHFYLICSMTPKRFVQQFIFPNPSFVLICGDWSISFKAVFECSAALCTAVTEETAIFNASKAAPSGKEWNCIFIQTNLKIKFPRSACATSGRAVC